MSFLESNMRVLETENVKLKIENARLREAVKEVWQAGYKACVSDNPGVYELGFNAAREKAKGIASDHAKIKGPHLHKGFAVCVSQVAAEIALMEPEK